MGIGANTTKDLGRRLKEISEKLNGAHKAVAEGAEEADRTQIISQLAGAKSEIENILVELSEVRHGGREE